MILLFRGVFIDDHVIDRKVPTISYPTRAHGIILFKTIHLRATRAGFALENIVIVAGISELKSSYCDI